MTDDLQPGRHRPPAPGRRRAEPPGRRKAEPAGARHRGEVKPRYGRIVIAMSAVSITAVAVLGSTGVLAPDVGPELASSATDGAGDGTTVENAGHHPSHTPHTVESSDAAGTAARTERRAERQERRQERRAERRAEEQQEQQEQDARPERSKAPLPEDSGIGKRVVFSESEQRVWLVRGRDRVGRTYEVSGSIYDNLDPGTYEVFSTSRHAVGIDDSGTMEYFVRFTYGDEGAAIGFHSIPVKDGEPVQTLDQLGTPLSHGCIRQDLPDAIRLWEFAPVGTTVVVTP